MNHNLDIPDFLRRDPSEIIPVPVHRTRTAKIPYPKDGYACKGKRHEYRERHKAALRRRAERMTRR
jgi:predicted amidophosphoribosyltransferase